MKHFFIAFIFILIIRNSWIPGKTVQNKLRKLKQKKERGLFLDSVKKLFGMETSAEKQQREQLEKDIPEKQKILSNLEISFDKKKNKIELGVTSLENEIIELENKVRSNLDNFEMLAPA